MRLAEEEPMSWKRLACYFRGHKWQRVDKRSLCYPWLLYCPRCELHKADMGRMKLTKKNTRGLLNRFVDWMIGYKP